MDWFSGLQAGQTLELGFAMTFAGDAQPNIVSLSLNGQDACSGSGTPEPTSTSSTTSGEKVMNLDMDLFAIIVFAGVTATTGTAPTTTTDSSVTATTTTSSGSTCSSEKYDYGKVLELSNLFYEAQRSGDLPDDNRVPWRGDSSLGDKGQRGEDLTGGYHDGRFATGINLLIQ